MLGGTHLPSEPKQIVKTVLDAVRDPAVVKEFCAPDVTYVTLNYSNPDLRKIMPWCGTSRGPDAIINHTRTVTPTFRRQL